MPSLRQVLFGIQTARRQRGIRKYDYIVAVTDGEYLNAKNCLHVSINRAAADSHLRIW